MSLLIHNAVSHPASVELYDDLGRLLGAPVCHQSLDVPLGDFDVLVSNAVLPVEVRGAVRCYGGILLSRPRSMAMMGQSGLPLMAWSTAKSRDEVLALFERWECERLILKRSDSFAGEGVVVFDRGHLAEVSWEVEDDLFCAEVNPESGDVYKAELFNGEVIISWMSEAPPLRDITEDGFLEGVKGAYGERRLFDFPPETLRCLTRLSEMITREGIGYVSVDLMKGPDGTFRAIEINLSLIATWWTVQFDFMKTRYAQALARLPGV